MGMNEEENLSQKITNFKFQIRYYGKLHSKNNLIIQTDFAPILVYAEEVKSKELILIFDGCKHGYDAMFCDKFSDEQRNNRPCNKNYTDNEGNEIFEVIITTQYGFDYDEEFSDQLGKNGKIELIDGSVVDFEHAKRNGFDWIMVNLINEQGKEIECISEETA